MGGLPPDGAQFAVGPEGVGIGWTIADRQWSQPPDAPAPPPDLDVYAADKRWRVETGGITVGGVLVATDDRSKTLIMGTRMRADKDPSHTLRFKAGGDFVTLDAATIIAVSDAVQDHTQASFDAEDTVSAAITAGTITTIQQVDAWPWPGLS